jgi:DNA polymerase III subunit epsilon
MTQTFIAFDFETTGINPLVAEIIEIGAVRFDAKGNVLRTFEQLIKPAFGIKLEAQAVNGISEAMVANFPSLDVVMPQFMMFLGPPEQDILIAHNAAKFAIGFLAMACARTGMPLPEHRIVDSIDLCAACIPKPHNLPSICRRLGITTTGGHRALADAMAVMQVVLRLGRKNREIWQWLPIHFAEDFGVRAIEPPIEFEEWEVCYDANQEVEIVYAGGSHADDPRLVIPKFFYECDGREFMTAFCLREGVHKTFEIDKIISVTLPGDSSANYAGLSEAMEFLKTLQPAGRPVTPDTPLENKPEPAGAMDNIWTVFVGVLLLVTILATLAFIGWLVDELGEAGAMFALGGLLVFGLFVVCIFNTVNGLFDSMFGPRGRGVFLGQC